MCSSKLKSSRRESISLVVLISGFGSNLQAIIDEINDRGLPATVGAVISDRPDAYGLTRAETAGIPAITVDRKVYPNHTAFEAALRDQIDDVDPDLIVLAGFMRILSPPFVEHFANCVMNIHPSLLPAYRGLHTHVRALQDGATEHGATVHFVTPELDAGPIIIQAPIPVLPDDTPERLEERVHEQEHRILPLAIRWFAEQRLTIRGDRVLLDGALRPAQGLPSTAMPVTG